jgi:type IV secretion system protein VirB9
MIRLLIATMALAVAANPARAETPTGARTSDPSIRVEEYDFHRVVPIYTAVNEPTVIQFEEDERVVDTDQGMVGMGDGNAWSIGPKGSNIMLKPKAEKPDTKMLVVTNKRTYVFKLISITPKSHEAVTNVLRFFYKDSQRMLAEAKAKKEQEAAARAQKIDAAVAAAGPAPARNRNYMKQGDEILAPSFVEDDGRFTFMRFDSTRPLPVVFKVLPDGEEAIANFHMEPQTATVVIHEVAANFVLRYGKSVMGIRNDGYRPDGKINVLGTTVPNAIRLQKDPL